MAFIAASLMIRSAVVQPMRIKNKRTWSPVRCQKVRVLTLPIGRPEAAISYSWARPETKCNESTNILREQGAQVQVQLEVKEQVVDEPQAALHHPVLFLPGQLRWGEAPGANAVSATVPGRRPGPECIGEAEPHKLFQSIERDLANEAGPVMDVMKELLGQDKTGIRCAGSLLLVSLHHGADILAPVAHDLLVARELLVPFVPIIAVSVTPFIPRLGDTYMFGMVVCWYLI